MKNIFTIAVIALSINIFAQAPTNGLVAYYPFNGNADDESGNGNNGIVNGATLTKDRFGNSNCAFLFSNSYIEAIVSNIPQKNSPRAITGWFKSSTPNPTESESCIVNYGSLSTFERFGICLYGKGYIDIMIEPKMLYTNNYNYFDDNWNFFAVMYDSIQISLFVNGIDLTGSLISYGEKHPLKTTNNIFRIGRKISGDSKNEFFNGIIDDIRIYNRVLNQAEITALYIENRVSSTIGLIPNDNNIKIFPNPSNGLITIDFRDYVRMDDYTLRISNLFGQTIYNTAINQESIAIDLSVLSRPNIYFMNIVDSKQITIVNRKVVIQ